MDFKVDFIGIGTHKSGTTTLSHLLDAHPQICLSIPKEIKYFNKYNNYWQAIKENPNQNKPIRWYAQHFSHREAGQIKGEFTNAYFIDSEAPTRIKDTYPNVKLLLSLRNPTKRSYSEYQMLKNVFLYAKKDFSTVIREEKEIVEKSLYFKHISRYLQYFDASNLKIIFFEDLKNNPKQVAQEIYRFLGVDSDFLPSNVFEQANSSKKANSKLYYQLHLLSKKMGGMGGGKIIKWLRDKNITSFILNFLTKPYTYPPMLPEDEQWLKSQFLEDIEELEKLLEVNLSHWK